MRRFAKLSPRWYGETLGRAIRGKVDLQAFVPYLMAGPHTNAIGLYRLPLHYVMGDLGWDEERVNTAISELVSLGFCRHDPNNEVIWIIDGFRNEFEKDLVRDPTKREPRQIPMVVGLVTEVRDSPLANEFLSRYCAEYPVLLGGICAPSEGQGSPNLAPSEGHPRARAGSGSGSGSGLVSGSGTLSTPSSSHSSDSDFLSDTREGWGARAREERLPILAPVLSATERDSLASLLADPGRVDPAANKSFKLTDRKGMALERRHLLAAIKILTDPDVDRLAAANGDADDAFELWVEWRRRRWAKHRKESNPCRSEVPALRTLLEPGHEPSEILRALRVAGEKSWKGFKWEWEDLVAKHSRSPPRPGIVTRTTDQATLSLRDRRARGEV